VPDLEEHTIEQLEERCQNCGTVLTDAEKAAALERGTGVVLCTTCAAEAAPVLEEEAEPEL
jgi:hypothetical protein